VRKLRDRPSGEGCIILLRAAAGAALFVVGLLVFGALPAAAHARFLSSTPPAAAELQTSPSRVTIRFDEGVEISLGSLHVLGASGTNLAVGAPYHPDGNTHEAEVLVAPLPRGQYTVQWQIVAEDGHVGTGRFAFGVGVPAAVLPAVADASAGPFAATIVALLRFVLLVSLLLGTGLMLGALLAVRAPAAAPVSMLEFGAWLVLAFVAFVDIRVQSVITGGTLIATLNTRYGILHLALTMAALLGAIAVSGGRRRWELLISAAIVAVASESLSGHAATAAQPLVGVIFDAAHLLAAATWIGVLLTTLLAAEIVDIRRVSTVASYAVGVLLVTAIKQVLQNVSSWGALVTTAYGFEVCAKVVLFAIVALIAMGSRRRVKAGTVAALRTVRLEAILLTAVIAVTAVLVDSHPPR
jgi:copper transport protein